MLGCSPQWNIGLFVSGSFRAGLKTNYYIYYLSGLVSFIIENIEALVMFLYLHNYVKSRFLRKYFILKQKRPRR